MKIDHTYQKLIEDIKVQAETYSDLQMKSVYAGQKVALDKLHSLLGTLYIKYGVNGLLKMNASQKGSIGIDKMLIDMGKQLGNDEIEKVTSILSTVYSDTYYKNIYTMNKSFKVDLKFDILKKVNIDAAVNSKLDGELFSKRIWDNKADLIDKVHSSLLEAFKGNTTIDAIAKQVKDAFSVTAYESSRLVSTENSRIQSQASIDMAIDTGVEQHMWSATLDAKTNEEDASYDQKVYDIGDPDEPENPLHPNCRCCWINIPYKGWTSTQRRDNSTGEDISYTNYADWKKNNI